MAVEDGSDALVQGGAETPTAEVEVEPTQTEQPADPGEGDEPGLEPVDDDEEIDWNGKKFKAPKGVKAGILMQADYTRKTQEVAADREALKREREAHVQYVESQRQSIADHAQLYSIESELKRYENVDWAQYINDDPIAAQQHQARLGQLRDARAAVTQKIQNTEFERTQKAQQETAKRMEEAAREVSKIPGWGPELQAQLRDVAKTYGYSDEDIRNVDARTVKLLHAAFVGQKALATKIKPAAQQQPAITPLPTVQSRTSPGARKPLADMSMEEYVAARKAGRTN